MTDFLAKLQAGLNACQCDGGRIVLAVSGGPDSVALLRGMQELRNRRGMTLFAAHVNHGLRGKHSDDDARWLATLAESLGIPLAIRTAGVAETAAQRGAGLEETARDVRYQFLRDEAIRTQSPFVAVAHTADDQVETILHHIVRGTGLAGLRGMPVSRPLEAGVTLVRPLLEMTRGEVEAWLAEIGQPARTDETNADPRFTRNRIRTVLLPLLEAEFNPQIRQAIHRLCRQAADVEETLSVLADDLLARSIRGAGDEVIRLDCTVLAFAPRHLLRECLHTLWRKQGWPRQKMGFDEWDRLAELVHSGGTFVLPGAVEATRRGSLLVIRLPQIAQPQPERDDALDDPL